MNEWLVFTALGSIIGLFITVGKPLISLNKNITTLNVNLEHIKEDLKTQKANLKEQREHASESHRRLWTHNNEQDKKLADHETRIENLEKK